ncbi:hypothetical protein JCM21900_002949 [Sporobolomyces salmonicolor]
MRSYSQPPLPSQAILAFPPRIRPPTLNLPLTAPLPKAAPSGRNGLPSNEKIECVPAPPPPSLGSQAQENSTAKVAMNGAGKRDGRFVELIGPRPNKLWIAGESESSS